MKAEMIKCPCQRCCLVRYKIRVEVKSDLICHGFLPTYTNWYLHGEELDTHEDEELEPESRGEYTEDSTKNLLEDQTNTLLEDVFPDMAASFESDDSMPREDQSEDHPKQSDAYDDLLSDCNEALYEGCQSFSKLSFMLKLYHIKCMCRISDKEMSMVIDLLKEAFEHAKLPDSFNDMKKIIRKLGFTYQTIHACDAESGFTKLLDLCKCTDRGSMGIEHKDWLLSTLCNYGFWIKLKQKYD
ncbi:unnamed protein product [Microthlaspi erraticum]|uniref:Transposase-associated domain-containing protein n=1 Tax=Microthlaspi erraticum TaxID=1685480 RepID=A0A6D2JHL6_9BRAS|nr:unnamed protein product [Microthlaspi erraticum]